MAENKMAQIAELFGKKLGEVFAAEIYDTVSACKFTHNGLQIKLDYGRWYLNNGWLACLLTGEAKIVEDEE